MICNQEFSVRIRMGPPTKKGEGMGSLEAFIKDEVYFVLYKKGFVWYELKTLNMIFSIPVEELISVEQTKSANELIKYIKKEQFLIEKKGRL